MHCTTKSSSIWAVLTPTASLPPWRKPALSSAALRCGRWQHRARTETEHTHTARSWPLSSEKRSPYKEIEGFPLGARAVGGCAGITHTATLSVQRFNPFLGDMDLELLCCPGAQAHRDKAGKQVRRGRCWGCLRRRVGLLAAQEPGCPELFLVWLTFATATSRGPHHGTEPARLAGEGLGAAPALQPSSHTPN